MNILSCLVIIPLLTITCIMLVRDARQAKVVSAIGMGIQLIVAFIIVYLYLTERKAGNTDQMLLVSSYEWFKSLNIYYTVGVDGISVAMIALTSIVVAVSYTHLRAHETR